MLLEMVCSHWFLYFNSPSSQETQSPREGKPQMTLVQVSAKSGGCLKRVLPCVSAFISPPIPHLHVLQIVAAVTGLALWDGH